MSAPTNQKPLWIANLDVLSKWEKGKDLITNDSKKTIEFSWWGATLGRYSFNPETVKFTFDQAMEDLKVNPDDDLRLRMSNGTKKMKEMAQSLKNEKVASELLTICLTTEAFLNARPAAPSAANLKMPRARAAPTTVAVELVVNASKPVMVSPVHQGMAAAAASKREEMRNTPPSEARLQQRLKLGINEQDGAELESQGTAVVVEKKVQLTPQQEWEQKTGLIAKIDVSALASKGKKFKLILGAANMTAETLKQVRKRLKRGENLPRPITFTPEQMLTLTLQHRRARLVSQDGSPVVSPDGSLVFASKSV